MKRAATTAVFLAATLLGTAAARSPLPAYESPDEPSPKGQIDELVFARWKELKIEPARVCSEGAFVRRVFLDVIGTLPTQQEARAFLDDQDPQKRAKLIDRLLERREFADYWALKWSDLLRVKSEFPINLWPNAVQAYHRWIRTCVKENLPYDRFVREMLTASGSNFRVPQVNFYRAVQSREPLALAQTAALTFMGVRPESWPAQRWSGMAGFFGRISFKATGEWKEEIIGLDLEAAGAGKPIAAVFPDGTPARLAPTDDPRKAFADWLIRPENPWFTRLIANRVWSWFLGRGIVHEPDDLRPENPPVNPQLLAHLEQELIAAKYDLKHLFRSILNSQTYQLASIPRSKDPQAAANFAAYPLRRLEAEVLIDALCQITGKTEQYSSPIPEPFTYIPEKQRTIALADASITSSFLEKFGRPPRDTGMETERVSKPTAAQRLHMLNSSHIQRKIEESPQLSALLPKNNSRLQEALDGLYLTILSRFPTAAELAVIKTYSQAAEKEKRQATLDLIWALINSAEFNYRH